MTKALKPFRSRVCQVENECLQKMHRIGKRIAWNDKRYAFFSKSEAHFYTLAHDIVDPINGRTNISFMKITRFVRTNTWFLYVLFYVIPFFLHIALEECQCFFLYTTNNASMLMVKCAVYWLVSASALKQQKNHFYILLFFHTQYIIKSCLNRLEINSDKHFYPL